MKTLINLALILIFCSVANSAPYNGIMRGVTEMPIGDVVVTNAVLNTSTTGKTSVFLARNDYSSVNVTTAAYTQLVASTTDTVNQLYIFDSSGQTLYLAVGAAASEVDKAYIVQGGNGILNLTIPTGSRISIKAITGTASVGEINITGLK